MPTKTPRDWKKEIQSDGKPHYNVVWDKVFSFPIGGGYDAKGDEYLVQTMEREDALKMVTFIETLLEEARKEEREKAQGLEKLIEEIGKKMCHFKFLYPNAGKWLIQDMWGWEYQGETLMEVFQAFKKEREKQEKS